MLSVFEQGLIWSIVDSVLRVSVKELGRTKGRDKDSVKLMVRIGNTQGLGTWVLAINSVWIAP